MGGYWALRALVFGVCATILVVVIATACTQDSAIRFASPTLIPSLTLTLTLNRALSPPFATLPPVSPTSAGIERAPWVYVTQGNETLEHVSADFGLTTHALKTANPNLIHPVDVMFASGQRVIIPQITPNPDLPPLMLVPPTCAPTEPENLLCLGSVFNTLPYALREVTLRVMLTREDGTVVAKVVTVEQHHIPPQSRAAYAVRFVLPPRVAYQDASVTLLTAYPAPSHDSSISLAASPPRLTNGRYVFNVTVTNTRAQPADSVQVYAAVYDAGGRVVGYRLLTAGNLEAMTTRLLAFDIPLIRVDSPLHVELHSESQSR